MHPLTGLNVVFALKGDKGWAKQALAAAGPQDIDLAGRKIRKGVALYRVGTWPLKSSLYAELEKLGVRSGQPIDPPGYVHLPQWVEENYVKQLVSETLSDDIFRGKRVQVWRLTPGMRDNHYLDCRIYNKALAEHIGLSKMVRGGMERLTRDAARPTARHAFVGCSGRGRLWLWLRLSFRLPTPDSGRCPNCDRIEQI